MASIKLPVVVWEDYQGQFTAMTLDGVTATSVDITYSAALQQLKDYLVWYQRRKSGIVSNGFESPRLTVLKVSVRAEYRRDHVTHPVDPPLTLRLPCVFAQANEGFVVCCLPTIGYQARVSSETVAERLAREHVAHVLAHNTPLELSRHLPPKSIRGDWIRVKVDRLRSGSGETELQNLQAVADPLGEAQIRRQLARAWGRDAGLQLLVRQLGEAQGNVLLVGESGVGKTALLLDAVRKLERDRRDAESQEWIQARQRFWRTSGGRLIGGMRWLGQWQARCEAIIDELSKIGGVLCLDDLTGLLSAAGESPGSGLAGFFAPYLEDGQLRMVAETTPKGLQAARRLLPGFVSLFQIHDVPELEPRAAKRALHRVAQSSSQKGSIEIERDVVDQVYGLFHRYLPYVALPGPCVGFINRLVERVKADGKRSVTNQDVFDSFVEQTGLPPLLLKDDQQVDPAEVAAHFSKSIVGQSAACRAASGIVVRLKSGLNDPRRPLAVQLYCGPTGVGKTELAKQIANYLFGHGKQADRLLRLDMSEYSGHGAGQRLLSRPDGQPSALIRKVRAQPFMVVLLDEIEKASHEVFDVLLGLFDEGRLTDSLGRVTTFRSCVIIMTSNLGADTPDPLGFDRGRQTTFERHVMSFFRPEFFNRIDDVVTFQMLDGETIRQIAAKELRELEQRDGLRQSGLTLDWSEAVVDYLSREGFDRRYGARPLQRVLEARIVAPLAKWLAEHPTVRGCTLLLDMGTSDQLQIDAQ